MSQVSMVLVALSLSLSQVSLGQGGLFNEGARQIIAVVKLIHTVAITDKKISGGVHRPYLVYEPNL